MSERINRRFLAAIVAGILVPGSVMFAKTEIADDKHPVTVDKHAKQVVEEKKEGEYKLPAAGKVWLFDISDDKALYSIDLDKGDVFAFNADKDHVYCNGKEGDELKIKNDHKYRIYFLEDKSDKPKEKAKETAHNNVPDSAKVVMEGRDKELSYKADKEGTAYLWDNTNNKLIETFHLHDGDRLTVSPKSSAVSVNDKTIKDLDVSRKIEYRLLFDVKN